MRTNEEQLTFTALCWLELQELTLGPGIPSSPFGPGGPGEPFKGKMTRRLVRMQRETGRWMKIEDLLS